MLLNTDGHGNVSYTFENAELNKRRVLDYWTPERKAAGRSHRPDRRPVRRRRPARRGDGAAACGPLQNAV